MSEVEPGALHRVVGRGWGGEVYRVSSDQAREFFLEADGKGRFTKTGRSQYLRLFGISASLYDNQDDETRESLLKNQAGVLKAKADGIYVLVDPRGDFVFAAPVTRIGWKDPSEYLDLNEDNGWFLDDDDPKRGRHRYVRLLDPNKPTDEYAPALFVEVPYFYAKPVTVRFGLYKMHGSRAILDKVHSETYRFRMDEFASDVFAAALDVAREAAQGLEAPYASVLEALRGFRCDTISAREIRDEWRANRTYPKSLSKAFGEYLETLEAGESVDDHLPGSVESMMDVADAVSWFSHGLGKGFAFRVKVEEALLRDFWDRLFPGEPVSNVVSLKRVLQGGRSC